jgi:glycogen(starch) synthase
LTRPILSPYKIEGYEDKPTVDHIKVFMLGWEFPPFISGGLGTACYGLTKGIDQLGIKVTFVLPRVVGSKYATHVKLLTPKSQISRSTLKSGELKNVVFRTINSPLQPYSTPDVYQQQIEESLRQKHGVKVGTTSQCSGSLDYSSDMYAEVHRYALAVVELAGNEQFDVVHAHDWMTYPAGIAVSAMSEKPLIVHVHSTEFDRSGENVNQMIYDIEREGMERADKVIAVSHFTRNIIISRYGISGEKVEVVYNGVERNGNDNWTLAETGIEKDEKIVLFLGRITMQKGPEYFLQAAKKVLDAVNNVKFVMAGSGDLIHRAVEMAAELGIGHKVLFTGFLRGEEVRKIYKMADLYVMPSVSEPFGIAPLEALNNDVPVIISKQSGVSEVLMHALKVDFWDVNEIANKIVAVLKYPPLEMTLRNHGNFEVRKLRWEDSARRCAKIYEETLQQFEKCIS